MKNFFIITLLAFLLLGCGTSESAVQTAIAEELASLPTATRYPTYTMEPSQTAYPTLTPYPTHTSYPTYTSVNTQTPHVVTVTHTPGPSHTPTITDTPTQTPTFTATVTPFNVSGCVGLKTPANYWNITDEKAQEFYDKYDGQCVRFYYEEKLGIVATDYGWITGGFAELSFISDELSPDEFKKVPDTYTEMWGIWGIVSPGKYEFTVRRMEEFPQLQQPIKDDGFYLVGPDNDLSAGQWKSLWPPGQRDSCYWARTNPDTGNIKDNHFGLAGIYVRLYNGDMFESDDCAPWIFVQP